MTEPNPPSTPEAAVTGAGARAEVAATAVHLRFGGRLLGLPGTYLPRVSWPGRRDWRGPWNFWWLAHHVDCLVDAAQRARRAGEPHAMTRYAARAHLLLRTIRLRNVLVFTNAYYDDMGWLLLAAQRVRALTLPSPSAPVFASRGASAAAARLATVAARAIAPRLAAAETPDLGGGLWWNTSRDFKNVPATGPAAIFAARIGDTTRARRLVDWMYAALLDPVTGLFLDGMRIGPDRTPQLVRDVYSYNQGLVLGALIDLGDADSLRRAAALIDAVDTVGNGLIVAGGPRRTLAAHGGGDGGLFTGILARYLARAAGCPDLDHAARARAADLVCGTAQALWSGRHEPPTARATGPIFSPDPAVAAAVSQAPGIPVELSTQLQAWMILEAAAALTLEGWS